MVYKKRTNIDFLYQFIPEQFLYLEKTKKIKYKGENLKTAYLINIIDEVLKKYYFNKGETIDKELKIPLWSILLKKKYGIIYNYYVDYLIDNQFMILASDYFNGGEYSKCREYKINRKCLINIKRTKTNDTILLKKYSQDYLKVSITEYSKSPIEMSVRKKLVDNLYDVNLDTDNAINYIQNLRDNREIDFNKWQRNIISLESIGCRNIFFKFDEYGRMHTNFTILKKYIRENYITIDNQKIAEVDLPNSQPLFLAVLMKKTLTPKKLIHPEISRYIELVDKGLLYEELMNKSGIHDRKLIKTMVYTVLFGTNSKNGNTKKENLMFHKVFPTVFKFITDYKKKNKNYKKLSHILQNMESEFIFNTVIKHIMNTNPKIKMFTIHDSIITTIEHKDTVRKIFDYHIRKLL